MMYKFRDISDLEKCIGYCRFFFCPFSAKCLPKGHTYLNERVALSCRFVQSCMLFSGLQSLKG